MPYQWRKACLIRMKFSMRYFLSFQLLIFCSSFSVVWITDAFDNVKVIFPELGREEAERHLDEMKCALGSPSINFKRGCTPYSREGSIQSVSNRSVVSKEADSGVAFSFNDKCANIASFMLASLLIIWWMVLCCSSWWSVPEFSPHNLASVSWFSK